MKTLMLNAEDRQTFGKLLHHEHLAATTVTATPQPKLAHTDSSAATQLGVASAGGVGGNNLRANGLHVPDGNLVALQYYLKHPSNYAIPTSTATSAPRQLATQTQAQLKQNSMHHQQHQHISNYHHHHHHQHQHHHHPYYQQQQQQQHQHQHQQQQQQQQQQTTQQQLPANVVAAAPAIVTQSHSYGQQVLQTKASQHSGATPATVLPVHALNQNSNFSAASSSTGGGTTTASSHAPTQQSNTTGSSFSPPGATANKRTTPASNQNNNNNNNNNNMNNNNNNNNNNNSSNSNATVSSTTPVPGGGGTLAQVRMSIVSGTKKLKTEPLLSQFHQNERLTFANTHIVWSEEHWKRVVFQDERKFNLDGPDGFSYYFHDLRNYERTLSQRPRGNSVFVYLVVTAGGPIHLDVSTSKQKPETCIETILRERTNISSKLGHTDFLLQDHNWTATALPTAQEWLGSEGIKLQKWPTIAHDLNIMENVWGWLIREVYDGGRKFSRKDDLIFRIREAWARLPLDLISNLYTTLPDRITELYYTRGVYTNC